MFNLVGQQLGQYEVIALIGRGGMSTVYRARQASVGREVAIKVLNERAEPGSPFLERFNREVRIIANLEHIHILPIYDYGQVENYPYLVMRYLDGGSLNGQIRNKTLTLDAIDRLIGQICSALDYAHERGVIHRDMKPHNVLLDRQGNAYLCDFGIAKTVGGMELTRTGEAVGTPTYMAPEQWQGLAVGPQSDVYALGIMLYEMFTGEAPFKAESIFAQMYKHLNNPAPLITSLRPDLPPMLDEVLLRATAKLPADRYASAGELARAVSTALRSHILPTRAFAVEATPRQARPLAPGAAHAGPTDANAPTEMMVTSAEPITGRAWVIDAFERWRDTPGESPVFFLVGPHGIGKSTLIKRFAERLGSPTLHYDLTSAEVRALDPHVFVQTLAAQLAAFLPGADAPDVLAEPTEAFEAQVLGQLAASHISPIYLLIDGLDAAFEHPGLTIVDLVRAALRNWPDTLRMVVAATPHPRLNALFRNARRLELQPDSSENRADLHATLSARFATLMPNLSGGEVDLSALLEKSGGNPLYLTTVLDHLTYRRLTLADLATLPVGLEALYAYLTERAEEADPEVGPLLHILAAARSPLDAALLADILDTSQEKMQARLLGLRPLVRAADEGWKLAHPALRYWLVNAPGIEQAHGRIAGALLRDDPAHMSDYAMRHLPAHLALAGQADRAYSLLTDLNFLATQLGRIAQPEVIDGFAQVALALSDPDAADQERAQQLDAVLTAVRRAAPLIPGNADDVSRQSAIFAQLYNHLIGTPGLDKALSEAARAWPHPWLRLAWPLPAPQESSVVWHGATVIALAAARAPGEAASRLAADPPPASTEAARRTAWLAACADGALRLWIDGELTREWIGHSDERGVATLTACALSSDGRLALSGAETGTARLWDVEHDAHLREFAEHRRAVTGCAFSLDGSLALTASDDRLIRVWDVQTSKLERAFSEHPQAVKCCAFALVDGRRIAISGAADGVLRVWDVADNRLMWELSKHRGAITACAATEYGAPVAVSGASDGMIYVWSLRTGAELRALTGAAGGITALVVGEVANRLIVVAASDDAIVRAWDVETGQLLARFVGHQRAVLSCALEPGGRVLSGGLDGTLRRWALPDPQVARLSSRPTPVEAHGAEVRGCAFTPDSARLLTASLDRELRVWNVESGRTELIMKGHTGGINACALRADGRVALSASTDRTLRTWDMGRGTMIRLFTGHGDTVTACAFSAKPMRVGTMSRAAWLIASGSADRTLRVWDAENGQTVLTLKGHHNVITGLAFSPVDELLVSLSHDWVLRLWSLVSGAQVGSYEDDRAAFTACAFSPDGRSVLTGMDDGRLIRYDRTEGTAQTLAESSGYAVTACGFSSSGLLLFGMWTDATLRVWDVRKSQIISTHRAGQPLSSGAFAPDNATLAVGDVRGGVSLLKLEGFSARRKTSLL